MRNWCICVQIIAEQENTKKRHLLFHTMEEAKLTQQLESIKLTNQKNVPNAIIANN